MALKKYKKCRAPDCDRKKVIGRGYCRRCYTRMRARQKFKPLMATCPTCNHRVRSEDILQCA